MSCNPYNFFLMSIGSFVLRVDSIFSFQWQSQCDGMAQPFQVENHVLMNSLNEFGDDSSTRIYKYLSAADYTAHRENSMQHHFYECNY